MKRISILIVEDSNADLIALQHKTQTDHGPYDYAIAQSVADGLKQFGQRPFDLVFVDHRLPDGDGFALLDVLQDHDTPVVFMATSGDEAAVIRAMQAGAADYVIKDGQQAYITLLPTIIDRVLARRQIADRMHANEVRYRSIIEDQAELVCRYDADLNITFANSAYCKFAGVTFDEIIGRSILNQIPPNQHDKIKSRVALSTPIDPFMPMVVVYQAFGIDKKLRWLEWKDRAVVDDQGKIIEYQAVGRDITEQKEAEQALLESEARYRQMFEIHGLPKLIVDPENGRIVDANPAAARFYGDDIETLKTRDVFALNLSPADEVKAKMAEAAASPMMSYELVQRAANDNPREVEVFTGPFEIDGKKLLYSIITDVTEKQLAKRSLEEANNLLEQRVAERSAELEKINDRIEAIFNHSADSLLMINVDGTIQQANQAFDRLFGVEINSYIGLSLLVFVHADDRPLLKKVMREIRLTHVNRQAEVRAVRADGTVFDVHLNIAPVNQSEKAVTSLVCLIHDISERKQLERVRRESEAMLKNVVENIPVQIFWKDKHSIFQGGNTLFARHHGLPTSADIAGLTDYDFSPEHAAEWRIDDQKVMATGQPELEIEASITQSDGTVRWLRSNKVPLRDSSGAPIGVLVTIEDVTTSKQAERAIAEERNLLRTVIDTVPDFIYFKDTQHRLILNNIAHQKSLGGRTQAEVAGKTDFELFPADMAAKFTADEDQLFRTNVPILNTEERSIGQDGGEIWALTTKIPLRNLNGDVIGLVGITHDVSRIKANEEALRRSEQQLRESQKMLRLVLDTIPVRVFWKDRQLVLQGCNRLFAQDLGFDTIDALIGVPGYLLPMVAVEEEQFQRNDREVMETGVPKLEYEETLTLPGKGTPLVIQTSKLPLRNDQGDVVGVLGIYVDIGARKAAEQQLRYLASLQEHMYDAVIGTDLSYRIQSWNKAAERLYGWSAEEVIGKTMSETIPPTLIGETAAESADTLLKTGIWRGEAIQHYRDGTELYVLASIVLHLNEHGVPIGIIGVNRDITERKKIENALAEAYKDQTQMQVYLKALHEITLSLTRVETLDEFFRSVVEQGLARFDFERMGLLLYDTETGLARGTYGTDKDGKLLDENHLCLVPDQIKGVLPRILNRNERFVFEPETQLYDDKIALGVGQNAVASLWDGQVLGWISIDNAVQYRPFSKAQLDIFALYASTVSSLLSRKRAELDLLRVSQRLELATRSGRIGIWDWDIVHDQLVWDDRMFALYGISAADFPGTTAIRRRAVHPDDLARLEADLAAAINHEKEYDTEYRVVWPDGSIHHVKAKALALNAPDGRAERMIGVNIDITELKQAEQVLLSALEKQTELSNLKSQFVSMASHEFRTPLAVILSTTETLSAYRARLSDVQIDARLDKIKQQVAHMRDIMDDVLQLARLQAGKSLEFKPTLLDIDAMCFEIVEEFKEQPGNLDRINFQRSAKPLFGDFDRRLVQHVISNLISNGLKYSAPTEPIAVSLHHAASEITLIVKDHGIGIPDKDLPRLFEPFTRASNVGMISGTGLGLSIVKQAIEIHGGTITVESQEAVGTTFTVTIPTTLNQNG